MSDYLLLLWAITTANEHYEDDKSKSECRALEEIDA